MTTEVIEARKVRFGHKDLQVIVQSAMAGRVLDSYAVEQGHTGVLFEDGNYVETLAPGRYAFWKNVAKVALVPVDMRETMLDVAGQEIMGLEIVSAGVRDVTWPGDMKDLMNKVTEAKEAAEANLIVRRDQPSVGARRRPCAARPTRPSCWRASATLMRLRELVVLEKVAAGGKLNVVLGEKGLAERVVNLL